MRTPSSASRRAGHSPPPRPCTSATRRSLTHARAPSSSRATWCPRSSPRPSWSGTTSPYRKGAEYVQSLASLPLQRVVNDARVTDHHAIIPTRSEHVLDKMSEDERKVCDLVAKRFLAIFHPDAVFERTRVETTVEEHIFRTSGRILVEAGWRGVYGEEIQSRDGGEDDTGGEQLLPPLTQDEGVQTLKVDALAKETQPPRRYTEASLLGA